MDYAFQEIRMRQNLWLSIEEWNISLKKWNDMDFYALDVNELTNLNTKILKNCAQFEKYLPSTQLVPELKHSAEEFKEKLPVIGYLRNPNLKAVIIVINIFSTLPYNAVFKGIIVLFCFPV